MSDILTTILARKREEIDQRSRVRSLDDLRARVASQPPTRGFAAAIDRVAAGETDPYSAAEALLLQVLG